MSATSEPLQASPSEESARITIMERMLNSDVFQRMLDSDHDLVMKTAVGVVLLHTLALAIAHPDQVGEL